MKKIILVDGNNLLFRSYYATAYKGNFMKNSKGFPTNALYGFANMINKIIKEEKPIYMIVAFDKGKTFRHEKYKEYKAGRTAMPDELKDQFPLAKEMLEYMGIKYYEIDNYEADDIIGTFSQYCNNEEEYTGTIISSDKDLLQLITDQVDIKLLKTKDSIRYTYDTFCDTYKIKPENVVDLKALMGDSSDNIPGVKGVGEKTALKLLQEYKTLDNIYNNIDKIKGKLQEKLVNDKDMAYLSYSLATINKNVPMEIDINDIKYREANLEKLNNLYKELEFFSFLKTSIKPKEKIKSQQITNVEQIDIKGPVGIYLEILGNNYNTGKILGMGVYNDQNSYFITPEMLKQNPLFLTKNIKYTYDIKRLIVSLNNENINIDNLAFDSMTVGCLLDYNIKDDIAYFAHELGYDIDFYENVYGKNSKIKEPSLEIIKENAIAKAKFIYETKDRLTEKIEEENIHKLYYDIELPLSTVLAKMEINGVAIDENKLNEMGKDFKKQIDDLTIKIYSEAGEEFNISSPMQLSKILFEKLNLPHGKKTKNGYSTDVSVLHKLQGKHPIIDLILEYRTLSKLYNTYIEGLKEYIVDGKIHTIYTQNYTRTGRLSSTYPNLQNIPVRESLGKTIRKAFIPTYDYILSADYSQIELRILAHMSKVNILQKAFKEDKDIHTKTASDIFKVPMEEVTSEMRRAAKAVNFGIIYGISGFGLGENLSIDFKDAKQFIDTYLQTYPGIKEYMDNTISKAKETGYVKTMFNRKRNIPELKNPAYMIRQSGERIALNTPIQGTSADIIKLAMVKVYEKLKENKLKTKMIIQVHDELIFDVPKEELEQIKKIVKEVMENVCKLDVPLKIDINYGNNWYDAK